MQFFYGIGSGLLELFKLVSVGYFSPLHLRRFLMPHWMLATTTWQNDVDFPLGFFLIFFVVLQPNMVINIYMSRLNLCFLAISFCLSSVFLQLDYIDIIFCTGMKMMSNVGCNCRDKHSMYQEGEIIKLSYTEYTGKNMRQNVKHKLN